MPDLALDFSGTHPAPGDLAAVGCQAVLVYSRISTPPRGYLDECVARGIGVCPIFETAATRAFSGYGAGCADGDAAEGDLNRIGVEDGTRLWVNMADTPNAGGNEGAIRDYARGFAETFPGRWQLGAYGPLVALRAAQQGSGRFDALWAVETWGAPAGSPQQHFDFWRGQPDVALVQMANIPAPLAGTDTNWIINRDALGAWGDDMGLNEDQVREIINHHLTDETEFGISRFQAWSDAFINGPTIFGVSRFEGWLLAGVQRLASNIRGKLGNG